jgi:hypothetical protein
MTEADAISALSAAGLASDVSYLFSSEIDNGRVIIMAPPPGTMVEVGSTIHLTVGVYEHEVGMVEVPMVLGLPEAEAASALSSVGLRWKVNYDPTENEFLDGQVVEQDPPPGSIEYEGSVVLLTVVLFDGPF